MDRITVNYEECFPGEDPQCVLNKCRLVLGANVVDLPDWDIAQPSGVILALINSGLLAVSAKEKHEFLRPFNEAQRNDPLRARLMVMKAIEHLDISAIRYRNTHEGDDEEISYCVLRPEKIEVLDCKIIERV
ncbi:hypothetical protein [Leisingera sp. ANG59]|uniref:hypothetical protein n=1 Tax=Leisingera sp. ANG59 TaxID=2675221 RepID=UPI00157455FF|nr:hypothetical protein [Leisingera sp. ANG59]NSY40709.1 hypothetical protein [Leisingera sp. ANG59]